MRKILTQNHGKLPSLNVDRTDISQMVRFSIKHLHVFLFSFPPPMRLSFVDMAIIVLQEKAEMLISNKKKILKTSNTPPSLPLFKACSGNLVVNTSSLE